MILKKTNHVQTDLVEDVHLKKASRSYHRQSGQKKTHTKKLTHTKKNNLPNHFLNDACQAAMTSERDATPHSTAEFMASNSTTEFRHGLVDFYTTACRKYGVETDAGVLIALRFGRSKLRVSSEFRDKGMLPLAEVLLHFTELNHAFQVLDFSRAQVTSHGAIAVSEVLHATNHAVIELNLQNNKLGTHGARAIVTALIDNSVTKVLNLRRCF